ncbi:hypothetical protein C9994_10015, partial [Marivirga lumbricoides]
KNKILKPPFKEAAEETPLLLNKQFYFMKQFPANTIIKDDLPRFVAEEMEKAYPLNKFFRTALED